MSEPDEVRYFPRKEIRLSLHDLIPGDRLRSGHVDPHARRLVDAINVSGMGVQTYASCSGHYHKPSTPYIAFSCQGWDFLRFLLPAVTGLNAATRGQARLHLTEQRGDLIKGSIRLSVHLSVLPEGVDWSPIVVGRVNPPRRLVLLWWRELDELAAMIEEQRTEPGLEILEAFEVERTKGNHRRLPRWAKPFELG
jgi:hypothetical protein